MEMRVKRPKKRSVLLEMSGVPKMYVTFRKSSVAKLSYEMEEEEEEEEIFS